MGTTCTISKPKTKTKRKESKSDDDYPYDETINNLNPTINNKTTYMRRATTTMSENIAATISGAIKKSDNQQNETIIIESTTITTTTMRVTCEANYSSTGTKLDTTFKKNNDERTTMGIDQTDLTRENTTTTTMRDNCETNSSSSGTKLDTIFKNNDARKTTDTRLDEKYKHKETRTTDGILDERNVLILRELQKWIDAQSTQSKITTMKNNDAQTKMRTDHRTKPNNMETAGKNTRRNTNVCTIPDRYPDAWNGRAPMAYEKRQNKQTNK